MSMLNAVAFLFVFQKAIIIPITPMRKYFIYSHTFFPFITKDSMIHIALKPFFPRIYISVLTELVPLFWGVGGCNPFFLGISFLSPLHPTYDT